MRKSHNILKDAVEKIGAKSVAADLNLSSALVYKWCQEPKQSLTDLEASGAANPLDRLRKLYEITQAIDIVHWVCEMGDGFFVQNPEGTDKSVDTKIFIHTQKMIGEFSETLKVIADAYQDDKRISGPEAEKIRKEWEDLKRAGEAFVVACESGKFLKENPTGRDIDHGA